VAMAVCVCVCQIAVNGSPGKGVEVLYDIGVVRLGVCKD
jgi:hypothetical protein